MTNERKAYPSDVSNEEWHFCVPYLTLMKDNANVITYWTHLGAGAVTPVAGKDKIGGNIIVGATPPRSDHIHRHLFRQ